MDDLTGKLNAILNDPQAMQQVSALAGMLQNSAQSPQENTSAQTGNSSGLANPGGLGALAGLLGGQTQPSQNNPAQNDLMQSVMQIMPMLNSFQQEDDGTRLLQSLRPLLSPPRQKKLDEAARMMKLFRLLPMLKTKGML